MDSLLLKTLEALNKGNKRPIDVHWVGLRDGSKTMRWLEYEVMARQYEHLAETDHALVIVGDNWWLEQQDFKWVFKTIPVAQRNAAPLLSLRTERKLDAS